MQDESQRMFTCLLTLQVCTKMFLCNNTSIGSTRLVRRLCDLSSAGKFGQGGAKAKLSHAG